MGEEGLVPNVVFSCGAIKWNVEYLVYYSGADKAIGVAKLRDFSITKDIMLRGQS